MMDNIKENQKDGVEELEGGGVPSPSETIKSSLLLIDEIVKARGSATPSTRKDISVVTGKAPPTLILKLSTCVQYNLLANNYGKGYLPTKLYEQYTHPIFEEDKQSVLLKILNSPSIYKKLIEEFNGKILPQENGLANHLKNAYKLNPNSAVRAARVFLENLRFVGVIDSSNRLKYILSANGVTENERQKKEESINEENGKVQNAQLTSNSEDEKDMIEIKIPLKDKRKALVKFPENYTDADLDKIARIIRAYKQNDDEEK